EGVHEDVEVINHNLHPVELELRLEADADFADLFEVKDRALKKGELYRRVEDGQLVLGYRRGTFVRETRIDVQRPEAEIADGGFAIRLALGPRESWATCIDVVPVADQIAPVKYGHGHTHPRPNMQLTLDEWMAAAPTLETDWDALHHVYERSLIDLAALRFEPVVLPGHSLPAAGLPWFMTVFGRDSIVTSLQALPFHPELAETTLRALAARQ